MGWFKDATRKVSDVATGVATGGMYSTSGKGLMQGGGLKGYANSVSGGLLGKEEADPNSGLDLYNNSLMSGASQAANAKKQQYFGSTLGNLGSETEDYVGRLQGNLDKNVAKADLYNQQAGQQRALDNARAGLSGVDTSAMNEQGRRNAQFGAASINESAKRDALGLYGQSISNRIEGANQIDATEMQLAIAQMKQPQAQNNPGLLGSIFGGFGL